MKAILTKLTSTHNNLRTDSIPGHFVDEPKIGDRFTMYGKPLDKRANVRWVNTSEVKSIKKNGPNFEFETQNSKYLLLVYPDVK